MTETSTVKTEASADPTEDELALTPPERICQACNEAAVNACRRCGAQMCPAHSYHDEGSELYFCRACADEIVGLCAICDALYARPCRECGRKVCADHQVQVIQRWGWGGAPGQGGVTDWFPVMAIYCPEHGKGHSNAPRPKARSMKGYDASSPEW